MLQEDVSQGAQIRGAIGRTRRIRGRVQDQPFGFRRDRRFQHLGPQLEIMVLAAFDNDRLAFRQQHDVGIAHPIGCRDDDLVAGIERPISAL